MKAGFIKSRLAFLFIAVFFLLSCSEFSPFEPVKGVGEPTEYSYNYWLLQKTYLFEDELPLLEANGDSVTDLYKVLKDPFTRYVAPSKSEQTTIQINTSIVQGDVGLEYSFFENADHPLFISRVYKKGPAGKKNVPKYGNILSVNGVDLTGKKAYNVYDSILTYNKEIALEIAYKGDTTVYKMEKADVYAPTVFVDTLNGISFITITGFKPTTENEILGTYGELKEYLDSTKNVMEPRIIDLRGNPGGHVRQCIKMADLFIKSGVISTRSWRTILPDGKSEKRESSENARAGDAGENGKFIVLVNKGSASCAEIFTAAVSEGAGIPIAGTATYGKGIGQSTWKTKAGGLAIITNFEFLTPKRNSYNKVGITPDFECESASYQCGFEALHYYYNTENSGKNFTETFALKKAKNEDFIGAFLEGDLDDL